MKPKGTYIYCPYCGYPFVEHGPTEVIEGAPAHEERYSVKCSNCGATGELTERWHNPETILEEV